jgi:putative chitobiose transport system substrate-binding protein
MDNEGGNCVKKCFKIMSSVICATVLTSVAAGCGTSTAANGSGSADKQITLEFWTINLKKNFSDYINGLIHDYEKMHPNVKIDWVDVPGADVDQKLITALASGDVPDVVNETSTGLGVIPSDAVYPISDLVDQSKLSVYVPGLLKGVTEDGKVMAIPWYNGGPPIGVINTDLYKQAGLDPNKPPKTWEELLNNGKQIHAKLPRIYGSNDLPTVDVLADEGIPILSSDKKSAKFNTPKAASLVEKFVQGYKDGAVAPGAITKDTRQYPQTVDNGLVAQAGLVGAFNLVNWEKNSPQIIPKLKVIPAVTGTGKLAINDMQLFLIPKKSKHPKEAADFALFVTNPTNQLKFCKLVPIFPSTTETLKDPFFTDIKVKSIEDAARKIMVQEAPNMIMDNFGKKAEDLLNHYNDEIVAAVMQKKSAQQALSDAVTYWNSVLSSN